MEELVSEGFVPVVHGDAVLDVETGCAILSADSILEVFSLIVIYFVVKRKGKDAVVL